MVLCNSLMDLLSIEIAPVFQQEEETAVEQRVHLQEETAVVRRKVDPLHRNLGYS